MDNNLILVMQQYTSKKHKQTTDDTCHYNYGYWAHNNGKFHSWVSNDQLKDIISRQYLKVPFELKDIAKKHKARWDPLTKLWYININEININDEFPDELAPFVIDNNTVPLIKDIAYRMYEYCDSVTEPSYEEAYKYIYRPRNTWDC